MADTYKPEAYVHPLDGGMTDKILRFQPLKAWMDGKFQDELDDVCDFVHSASCVRLPKEHALYRELDRACQMFQVKARPALYVKRDYGLALSCVGYHGPAILIPSSMLERGEPPILAGRLSAQVAAIAAGHHKLGFVMWVLENMDGVIPVPFAQEALLGMLYEWNRCRIYTTDRAFYLATGDYALTLRNILYGEVPDEILDGFTFGHGKTDTFLPQVERFMENGDIVDMASNLYGFLRKDSWMPKRYDEISRYVTKRGVSQ